MNAGTYSLGFEEYFGMFHAKAAVIKHKIPEMREKPLDWIRQKSYNMKGFLAARGLAVKCLREGRFLAEDREDEPCKNLLAMGFVNAKDVERILQKCRGDRGGYEERPHHDRNKPVVHIFKCRPWYIKLFFRDPECVFVSVHSQYEIH